jgi:hypothetical protein
VIGRRSNQLNFTPANLNRQRTGEKRFGLVMGSRRVLNYPGCWVRFAVFRLSSLSRSLDLGSEVSATIACVLISSKAVSGQ